MANDSTFRRTIQWLDDKVVCCTFSVALEVFRKTGRFKMDPRIDVNFSSLSHAEYGGNVGIWRILEILERQQVRRRPQSATSMLRVSLRKDAFCHQRSYFETICGRRGKESVTGKEDLWRRSSIKEVSGFPRRPGHRRLSMNGNTTCIEAAVVFPLVCGQTTAFLSCIWNRRAAVTGITVQRIEGSREVVHDFGGRDADLKQVKPIIAARVISALAFLLVFSVTNSCHVVPAVAQPALEVWPAGTRLLIPNRVMENYQREAASWTYPSVYLYANYFFTGPSLRDEGKETVYVPLVKKQAGKEDQREVWIDIMDVRQPGDNHNVFVTRSEIHIITMNKNEEDVTFGMRVGNSGSPRRFSD